jgi:transcriptional regulator with XRE-family HTH domain
MSYRKVPTKPAPAIGADPYSEESVQRRLWALRAARGLARIRFAAQLGVSGSTLDDWDHERTMPTLPLFVRAALLLEADIEALLFGVTGRAAAAAELQTPTVLDIGDVREWLEKHNASSAVIASVQKAIRGRQKPATLEWLTEYVCTLHNSSEQKHSDRVRTSQRGALAHPTRDTSQSRANAKLSAAREHVAAHGGPLDREKLRAAGLAETARRRRKPA